MLKRSIAFLLIFLFIIGPSFTVAEYGKQNESVENALEPEICSGDLDTPQMVSVRNSVGGIKIDWNAVPGAEKYRVYRKLGSGNWCKLLDTTSNNCLDKWAKSGNTYSYSVRCISAEGSFTSDMDPVGLSVFYLSAPKLKDATWNKKSVAISWEAVDGAENYRVYRKTGNGSWTACTDTTGTAFTDNTVVSGTKYAYTVKCISADGKKVISACDSKGKTITFTNMPSVKSVNNVIAGVKIAWNAVPGASLYRVFRKTGNGGWCKLLDTTELSTVDKWAKSGTVYTYTIRCVTADGSQYASAYDNVGKTIKRIATPKISTLKNDVGGVRITNTYNSEEITIKVVVEPRSAIAVPSVPLTLRDTGYSYSTSATITDLDVRFSLSGSNLCIDYEIEKIYDSRGTGQSARFHFGYKLYDPDGYLIKSGTIYTESICTGDKYKGSELISIPGGSVEGDYRLELLNSN